MPSPKDVTGTGCVVVVELGVDAFVVTEDVVIGTPPPACVRGVVGVVVVCVVVEWVVVVGVSAVVVV